MNKTFCIFILLLINSLAHGQNHTGDLGNSYDKYILTPEPSPAPKINGPKIFGVRPGSPVIFTIPATGKRPMTFAATSLPEGLAVNELTGMFSGSVETPGTYFITLKARNELGTAEREFRLVVGNQLSLTPPMGWNSWNGWGDHVTDENVRTTADALVKTGLINYGWSYVNIDIGWQGKRGGKFNAIQPNERFPDMKGLTDYIHALGLKAGIYSSPWTRAYFNYTGGSSDYESGYLDEIVISKSSKMKRYVGKYKFDRNDVQQWEEWGMDYIKYDWGEPTDKRDSVDHIKYLSDALLSCKRDVVFSLCHLFPVDMAPLKLPYVQLWRTGHDIRDVWHNSMLDEDKWAFGLTNIWDLHREWREFTKPGNWADPDMLTIGWLGFGEKELHKTRLTPDEQYTQISLWCLWSAPLFIGSPVEMLDKFSLSLLINDEVIEINQDPLGRQAFLAHKEGEGEVWVKTMEDGSKAVGLFNRSSEEATVRATWADIGLYGKQRLRDVWRQKDIGSFENVFGTKVAPHGVVLLRIFPVNN